MRHVAAADGKTVAVAAGDQHQQLRVGQLDALRDGQRTPMHRVEAVSGRIAGDAARTANARDEGDFMRRPADGGQRPGDGRHHAEVAAPRTPDGFEIAFEIARLKFGHRQRFGRRQRFEKSSHDKVFSSIV